MHKTQVKRGHYFKKKYGTMGRFISYFYQIDLIRSCGAQSVLEVGKGDGVVSSYLKNQGLKVSTVDFDESLEPDIVADIRELSLKDNTFDVVVAFEVLEHIPFEDLTKALGELKRVSKKNVIISLPYRSTGFELLIKFPFIRTLFKKDFLNLFFRIPLKFGGIKISGQHYWEIDSGKYSLGKVRRDIKEHFKIIKEVRPPLNYFHHFFVLRK